MYKETTACDYPDISKMDPIDYMVQVRAPLSEALYPNCRFLLPMTGAQMSRRLNELWAQDVALINGMHLKTYGGALEYQLKKGHITAHSITASGHIRYWAGSRLRQETDDLQDHVMFEYQMPGEGALRQIERIEQLVRPEEIRRLEKELSQELGREVTIRARICQHTLYIWAGGICFDQRANGRDRTMADFYRNAHQVNKIFERVSLWLARFVFMWYLNIRKEKRGDNHG